MPVDLNAVRTDIAGKLTAEGLTVALDPRNVKPPCVVIGLPVVTDRLTSCSWSVDIEVTAVAPGPGNLDAIEWLLDTVPTLLDVLEVENAVPSSFEAAPGSGAAPNPAYTCVVSTHAS